MNKIMSKSSDSITNAQSKGLNTGDKVGKVRPIPVKSMEDSRPESEGLHRDLESLLTEKIKSDPDNSQLRARLLELYFSDQRKDAFLREATALNRACKRSQDPEAWDAIVQMGRRLLPDEQLFITMGEGIEFDFEIDQEQGYADEAHQRIGEDPVYAPYFDSITAGYEKLGDHPNFMIQLENELRHISNRPTPMMYARHISKELGGAQVYIKREDLAPTYTQLKISVLGQALMARRMGLETLVTASANGFRGVVTASIARRLGMQAIVFVDSRTRQEQPGNLMRMSLLGADVETVNVSDRHDDHDIREVALDHCLSNLKSTFMVSGLDAMPSPYPSMQMDFQSVIGRECMRQIFAEMKQLPDLMVARAGENPDAIGAFAPFLRRQKTALACVPLLDAFSEQVETEEESRRLVLHSVHHVRRTENRLRTMSRVLEGLEYPSVRREQMWLKATGRVDYPTVSEAQVVNAIRDFSQGEGWIPGIATAHALAYACQKAAEMPASQAVVVLTSEKTDLGIEAIANVAGVTV